METPGLETARPDDSKPCEPRRRWGELPAPFHTSVVDLNGDGHRDLVVAVLGSVYPTDEPVGKVVWLENRGQGDFTPWQIADSPSHLATVAVGDLNGDHRADIVAGSLHMLGPFDRLGRVTLWTSAVERVP